MLGCQGFESECLLVQIHSTLISRYGMETLSRRWSIVFSLVARMVTIDTSGSEQGGRKKVVGRTGSKAPATGRKSTHKPRNQCGSSHVPSFLSCTCKSLYFAFMMLATVVFTLLFFPSNGFHQNEPWFRHTPEQKIFKPSY